MKPDVPLPTWAGYTYDELVNAAELATAAKDEWRQQLLATYVPRRNSVVWPIRTSAMQPPLHKPTAADRKAVKYLLSLEDDSDK